jgi:ubiquinone/menaquinone biosynthesis C-methylase UbiE
VKKPNAKINSSTTDWNDVAQWYDQLVGESGSEFQRQVIIPGVMRLLSPRAGENIIDIACGQGVLCRALLERRINVTGVDAAKSLIQAAKARGPKEIEYHVGDARNLSFLQPRKFSAAACVLAIQNIHPLPPVFRSISKILPPMGKLVIVMMHPCFRGEKETSWGWDETNKVQYRRVDRYLIPRKVPITTHPGSQPDQYTWTFHRPLGAYIKALRQGGLLVDALEEWTSHKHSDSGPRAAAENTARKEIPLFLALRAIKVEAYPLPGESTEPDSPATATENLQDPPDIDGD